MEGASGLPALSTHHPNAAVGQADDARVPSTVAVASYRRREPERSILYRVIAAEIDGLREALATASPYGSGLPMHVEKDIEGYLGCGRLHRGFCRVVCRRCRAEHLVAFSCKSRAICPSCTTRRMHDGAAALVDRVFPHVPVRQWVTTFPRRVRYHLAADPRLATEALREVTRTIFAWQRRGARRIGARPARANGSGAFTAIQRFNSALEASLHFHSLLPDGVFVHVGDDPETRPRFIELDPPTSDEVGALLDEIIVRVTAMLRRHGRLDDDLDEEPEPHLLLASRPSRRAGGEPFVEEPLPPRCARKEGYSLHAATAVHHNDRQGLEQLARYCLRPPLAQGRLEEAPDGTILYTMKRRFSDGRHVLRFQPREFVLRLCALVPPRGFHVTRYAGIFSAHARGRFAITGRGMRSHSKTAVAAMPPPEAVPQPDPTAPPPTTTTPPAPRATDSASSLKEAVTAATTPAPTGAPRRDRPSAPDLRGPDDPFRERRLAWAVLLRRTMNLDALDCPRCKGRMQLIAAIEDTAVAAKILDHLGLPARPPPRGPPWRPQPEPALEHRADADHDGRGAPSAFAE